MYTSWTTGGPAGSLYGVSDSGWMERANFLDWFKKLFLPAIEHLATSPGVVLFVDGHHSHLSLELIELAKEKCVHLVCFPPHLTHILQPLDVSVYHPVKQSWAKVLKDYKLESMAEAVTKVVFPSLIKKLWDSFKTNHIVSGFRATGLHPLDPAPVLCKLTTSVPFHAPSSAPSTSDTSSMVTDSVSPTTSSSMATTSAQLPPTSSISGTVRLEIKGACQNCGAQLTPMRPHLTLHFEKLLQRKNADKKGVTRKRVRAQYYGEALTSDAVIERLHEEDAARKNKKRRKRSPTPEPEEDVANESQDSHDEGNPFTHFVY